MDRRHHNASQPAAVAGHHVSHQTTHHIPIDYKPAVRFYTKANKDYSLAIRDGKVVLASNNPSDHHQHWIKYEMGNTFQERFPSFALVNKATRQAIKHSTSSGQLIQLVEFNPDKLDVSVLWTRIPQGTGFYAVRLVNNTRIHLNACIGEHGGVEDGTTVALCAWSAEDNQIWATAPLSTVRFYTQADRDDSLTIRDGKVVLAPTNPADHHQHWIIDETFSTMMDEYGFPSCALVNKATGQAVKHSTGSYEPVQLVEFNPDKLDVSVLWTMISQGNGFYGVRLVNNTGIHLSACIGEYGGFEDGDVEDGTNVDQRPWVGASHQMNIV